MADTKCRKYIIGKPSSKGRRGGIQFFGGQVSQDVILTIRWSYATQLQIMRMDIRATSPGQRLIFHVSNLMLFLQQIN